MFNKSLVAICLVFFPVFLFAQTGGSVAICPICDLDPKSPPITPCPPCKTQTGFGICIPPGGPDACKSKGVTQGDGSTDMAAADGAGMMSKLAEGIMQALSKGGGGGGAPPPPPGAQNPFEEKKNEDVVNDVVSSLFGIDSASTSDAVNQITDLLASDENATAEDVAVILSQVAGITPDTTTVTAKTAVAVNPAPTSALEAVGAATKSLINRIFSTKTADDSGVTVSTQTTQGNTGIGAFFGSLFSSGSEESDTPSFFARLCDTRPWQSSIVSSIFSPSFFDTLCVRNGLVSAPKKETAGAEKAKKGITSLTCDARIQKGAPATIAWECPEGTNSGAVGFTTEAKVKGEKEITPTETKKYELQCSDGSRAYCTITVGEPKAELEASPLNITLGGRARLYWTSEGVESCSLTGAGMQETGFSGAATSPAIYDRTTFTLICNAADGQTVEDKVIIDVGL